MATEAPRPSLSVQSWINKGKNDIPEWVKPKMVGRRDPNGTFLIHTRAGLDKVQARVLVGYIVIGRKDVLYTRPPSEARGLLQELDDKDNGVYGLLPKTSSGPTMAAGVAPRDDDTDDITRRIRALDPKSADSPRNSASNPQKSAVSGVDPTAKELSGFPRPVPATSSTAIPQKSAVSTRPVAAASAPRKWPAAQGMPPSIENRNPSELNLDDSYQRSTENGASQALIRKIAMGWDWRMCLPLVVSKRDDGSLWVIDGQHL